jgi:anti-sigma factor RsiW
MSCSERYDVISAYLDGEATPAELEELVRHLDSCDSCRARVASLRAFKHGVSRLEGRARPPEAVFARVDALRFRSEPRMSRARVKAIWISAALLVVGLAFAAGRSWLETDYAGSLADELIADHMKYVPEAMPAEVASGEAEDVQRFFEGKVAFQPVVPSLEGASLLGGRLCRIRGYHEQLLFYERDGRKLSLYVSNRPGTRAECRGNHGYRVCGRRHGQLSLMLVGDAPDNELRALLDDARL